MSNTLCEGCQVKVRIIFVLQIIMGHITVPEAVDCDRVRKANGFADLVVGLIGTSGVAAAEREGCRAADIAVFTPDCVKLLLDFLLHALQLKADIRCFCLLPASKHCRLQFWIY